MISQGSENGRLSASSQYQRVYVILK